MGVDFVKPESCVVLLAFSQIPEMEFFEFGRFAFYKAEFSTGLLGGNIRQGCELGLLNSRKGSQG